MLPSRCNLEYFQSQSGTKNGQRWDKELDGNAGEQFTIWVKELQEIDNFSISRPYFKSNSTALLSYQLHLFSDASLDAMCIVAYIREKSEKKAGIFSY